MEKLDVLIDRARSGDLDAFGGIVRRFQDMALAYAYSVLGDFDLAEDAAQEAFLQAHRDLAALREPDAFPGWFRKIVFKHCDRITRRHRPHTVPLEAVAEAQSVEPGPQAIVEAREAHDAVLHAVSSLPDDQRTVVTLFYINGYTQRDIAEFLEVPVTTINNRLHASRDKLKERMVRMVDDELKTHGLPEEFPERVRMLLELPRPLTMEGHPVRELWNAFRSCFPDFDEIELEEVYERKASMLEDDVLHRYVYAVDERRILRPELTSQIVNHWISGGGGLCKLVTVGRVFRAGQNECETRLEVHHQAEILWAGEGLDTQRLEDTMSRVADGFLPGTDTRSRVQPAYPLVSEALGLDVRWRDAWIQVATGGLGSDEWLSRAGLDPSRFGAISLAFGLDRCALVRHNLDDIHLLWRPPYVPQPGG